MYCTYIPLCTYSVILPGTRNKLFMSKTAGVTVVRKYLPRRILVIRVDHRYVPIRNLESIVLGTLMGTYCTYGGSEFQEAT